MYTPHTPLDIRAMLDVIGVPSLEALTDPPAGLKIKGDLDVAAPLPEAEAYAHIRAMADENGAARMTSFLGAGAYRHYQPPAVPYFAFRSEFLTAYTPYQAEASQGSLQAIFEWQTYICLLTGMDVSNASVYDGSTALVEGVIMAAQATGRRRVAISRGVHPLYRRVLATYAEGMGISIIELPLDRDGLTAVPARLDDDVAAVIVQSPNFFGAIDVVAQAAERAHAHGALALHVTAEALSLAVLKTPRELGADIAVGDAQSFGLPVGYGGPYVGFVATTKEHVRRLPGRLVGQTHDVDGRKAYVLTLQGREQHIRRELASSNICTNQALCALIATIYLATVGRKGLTSIACANMANARALASAIAAVPGFGVDDRAPFFNEFVVRTPMPASELADRLEKRGILAGLPLSTFYPELSDALLVCATELTTTTQIAEFARALAEENKHAVAAV